MKTWKICQQMYNSIVQDHSDAASKHTRFYCDDVVRGALDYFRYQTPYGIYPGKSYAVAVIYAHQLSIRYAEDIIEVLRDPDLFCGQDPDFEPWTDDNEHLYREIIAALDAMPGWMTQGWVPYTLAYFHAECTEEGIEELQRKLIAGESLSPV